MSDRRTYSKTGFVTSWDDAVYQIAATIVSKFPNPFRQMVEMVKCLKSMYPEACKPAIERMAEDALKMARKN
jgi:hypothetical protein